MSITEISAALHEVRDAVEVPAVDRIDFQRRVRAERRRRTTGRALVAGAAVAAVVAGVALASGGGGARADRRLDQGTASHSAAAANLPGTVFFVLDGTVRALDPSGALHDLGIDAEGVVGWTSERVFVLDETRHLTVGTVSYDDEGSHLASFGRSESPVHGEVLTASLSGDGRYLGWTGADHVLHRYDLKAEREDLMLPGGPQTSVVSVGASGLLLGGDGGLVLRGADSDVAVPVEPSGYGVASDVAYGRVLVNDRDERARLYDVGDGSARLVETLDGFAALGPYAERVAVIEDGGTRVSVWDGGRLLPLSGFGASPDQLRWADETTLLIAAHDSDGSGLWECDVDLACQRLPVDGEVSLNR